MWLVNCASKRSWSVMVARHLLDGRSLCWAACSYRNCGHNSAETFPVANSQIALETDKFQHCLHTLSNSYEGE